MLWRVPIICCMAMEWDGFDFFFCLEKFSLRGKSIFLNFSCLSLLKELSLSRSFTFLLSHLLSLSYIFYYALSCKKLREDLKFLCKREKNSRSLSLSVTFDFKIKRELKILLLFLYQSFLL